MLISVTKNEGWNFDPYCKKEVLKNICLAEIPAEEKVVNFFFWIICFVFS